ncbi:hypothetical protein A3F32_02465 [Candidatus Roizmanbacteria bacterium RIFCSPHIGHO2_12_FULL_42_10]|uniref:Ribose-5-phosphate isomerase n=2 Tax=Candidatus Roizmaniibacteriota TaxID=1752723 RepID=A0A1F7I5J6_9BACT|nr:MAG: hypothetical protein A3D08_02295 [Candidatus Roizmanbacteria bacterium RIFCSPHIGHO2_02_FULL_43_11]OGK38647.1 MAG: hypothetical protein A3F32_02465 [Candidatus Roizmanbacteria bacterium RIFCSPHIGHO2_12_FULL_42_10]
MKIFLGADHRGFDLKEHLLAWLQHQGYETIDCGDMVEDASDDYVDFTARVCEQVLAENRPHLSTQTLVEPQSIQLTAVPKKSEPSHSDSPTVKLQSAQSILKPQKSDLQGSEQEEVQEKAMGIVICGSGIGVTIAANRFRGIRCALCISQAHAEHARTHDHANVLALASEMLSEDDAHSIILRFFTTEPDNNEQYIRRREKLDMIA